MQNQLIIGDFPCLKKRKTFRKSQSWETFILGSFGYHSSLLFGLNKTTKRHLSTERVTYFYELKIGKTLSVMRLKLG